MRPDSPVVGDPVRHRAGVTRPSPGEMRPLRTWRAALPGYPGPGSPSGWTLLADRNQIGSDNLTGIHIDADGMSASESIRSHLVVPRWQSESVRVAPSDRLVGDGGGALRNRHTDRDVGDLSFIRRQAHAGRGDSGDHS